MSDTIIEIDVPISVWIFTTNVPFLFRSPIDFLLWHRAAIPAMFYLNTEIYCAYFMLYIHMLRMCVLPNSIITYKYYKLILSFVKSSLQKVLQIWKWMKVTDSENYRVIEMNSILDR